MNIKVPACFKTHPAIAAAYRLGFQDAKNGVTPRNTTNLAPSVALAYACGGLDA